MKKTLFIISALLLMAATACQKDDGSRILKATLERYDSNDAKAYIDSDNYACWKSGDEVSINGIPHTITLDQEGHAVIDVSDLSHADLTAFYPAHRINGSTVTFPYIQEYAADDQGRQIIDNPMAAYCPADGTELRFRNLGALLKVTLKPTSTIQVRAIEVKGVDNQMLCGEATLKRNSSGDPILTKCTDGHNSVVLHFDTPQEVTSAGREFYIVVPASSDFYDFTIAVLASENGTYRHYCKTNTIAQALSRNHIGAIKYTLEHNDDTFMPAWGIRYTAEETVTPNTENWGVSLISNSNGRLLFDDILTTIGDNAFQECNTLQSMTLPISVTTIGDYAFHKCFLFTSITLPDNLTTIGDYAFSSCSFHYIALPNGLQSIGNYAFFNCHIENIALPTGLQSIGEGAFVNCDLPRITIPNGITEIKRSTFENCDNLEEVVLPASINHIGEAAFQDCQALKYIICHPTNPPSIGSTTFLDLTQYIDVYVPMGKSSAYAYAWEGKAPEHFDYIDYL